MAFNAFFNVASDVRNRRIEQGRIAVARHPKTHQNTRIEDKIPLSARFAF